MKKLVFISALAAGLASANALYASNAITVYTPPQEIDCTSAGCSFDKSLYKNIGPDEYGVYKFVDGFVVYDKDSNTTYIGFLYIDDYTRWPPNSLVIRTIVPVSGVYIPAHPTPGSTSNWSTVFNSDNNFLYFCMPAEASNPNSCQWVKFDFQNQ